MNPFGMIFLRCEIISLEVQVDGWGNIYRRSGWQSRIDVCTSYIYMYIPFHHLVEAHDLAHWSVPDTGSVSNVEFGDFVTN